MRGTDLREAGQRRSSGKGRGLEEWKRAGRAEKAGMWQKSEEDWKGEKKRRMEKDT